MSTTPARILISGASSGLGRALAQHYAKGGAVLGLIARRRQALEELAAVVPGAEIYPADVRDVAALTEAARHFIGRHGSPDIVIANAGVSIGTLAEHAEDLVAFKDVLDTNVMGMINTFHPFIAPMRAAGRGRLVGIASVAGFRGLPGAGAYSASKAAAIALLESLRVELRASGVRVVTVCPGYIDTPMTEKNPYPMPFMLSAEEAAAAIVRVVEQGKKFAVIPWQMALVGRALRILPAQVYDLLFARAPHKPRGRSP